MRIRKTAVMKAREIVDFVWDIAPNPPGAEENIYEFGDGHAEVSSIGVAWWITSEILDACFRKGIQMGITHERVIYDIPEQCMWGLPCATDELAANQRFADKVRQYGVTIHRFHSNIDLADWGMPHALIDQLGWSGYAIDWSRGIPVVNLPETVPFCDLIDHVKRCLDLPFVLCDGERGRPVSRVALAWGGLCQWWTAAACAAPLGFDVLIGGDVIDGVVRLAREQGWAVIDAWHHATEIQAMRVLARKLEAKFPEIEVVFFENTIPWTIG